MTAPLRAESEPALSGEVRALFADLAHGGEMAAAAGVAAGSEGIFAGEAGSREQGTLVRVQLRIGLADRTVREMRYRAFGCPYTLAVCEWLARRIGGCTLRVLSGDGLAEVVGTAARWCEGLGIPPGRLGRLLIIEDALFAALQAAAAK